MALGRVQYSLKLSLLSSCINFISRSSKKSVMVANQGVEGQSESTILLSMSFLLNLAVNVFGERVIFSKL
jgi:hypothetical protein